VSGGEGLVKKTKEKKKIEFDQDKDAAAFTICNTHIAWNGRFFAIGLVSE